MTDEQTPQRIDVVLPLRAGSVDRAARLAVPSIVTLLEPLGTLWVVTTEAGVAAASAQINHPQARVVSETEVLPELRLYQPLEVSPKQEIPRVTTTTQLQQTLKLAMAKHVGTPFYLCIDADTLCVQPTSYSDLVINGRGATKVLRGKPKSSRYQPDPIWPASARPLGSAPVVLPVAAVERFLQQIAQRLVPHRLSPEIYLLSSEARFDDLSIYFDMLRSLGLLGTYHQPMPLLTGNNVRTLSAEERWNVSASFESNVPFRFSHLSRSVFPEPEMLASRLRRHWPIQNGPCPF